MAPHPLDPLTAEEIGQAAAIVRRDRGVGERWRIASIELREPSKDVVRGWTRGDSCDRAARVVCWNRDDGKAYKALVSLTADGVLSWTHEPDGQPNMTVDEVHECDVAMRREPRVIEALARRGITDMDRVVVEAWAYGAHLLPEPYSDRRLGWADVWYRSEDGSNPYANPITGLHVVVDLNTLELLEVEDTGAIAEPDTMGEYIPRLVPGLQLRPDVKPLEITQPAGPSFTLEGNLLRWQKWSMRVGFNYREGLVLHTVGYEDSGGCGRWRTGCRSRRWSSPTATRPPSTTGAPRLTSASGGWAS